MHIGVGVADGAERVVRTLLPASEYHEITLFSKKEKEIEEIIRDIPGKKFKVAPGEDAEEMMIRALYNNEIDGAVRGTFPSNTTMALLKKYEDTDSLERIALLETADGIRFLLAPVGVDEGWTVEDKIELIGYSQKIAQMLNMNEKGAILSGGRLGDIGRHPIVDKTITDAIEVSERTGSDHMEILIEDAVRDHGIIIAPDGISGNLIFRTMALLGGGKGLGAPVANLSRIFVDTSRASSDYSNAVFLAADLADCRRRTI